MLQSMGSQRVGHKLVTKQQENRLAVFYASAWSPSDLEVWGDAKMCL